MKILFPYLARWRSANRSRYHQLLTQLGLLGHQVYVLMAPPMALNDISFTDLETAHSLPKGLTLGELYAPPALRAFWRWPIPKAKLLKKGLLSLSSVAQIRRFVSKNQIDVLMAYNLPQVRLLSQVECHKHFDLADDLVAMMEMEGGWAAKAGGSAAARLAQAKMLAQADSVTVASSVLAEQLDRKVFQLPNGADLNFLDQVNGREWRARLSGPCVGFVGAFEYWVNFDLVLDVAERLSQVTFLLVGGGRRWEQVRQEVERRRLANIHLTGALPYEQAMNCAAAMDVCLVPFTRSAVSDGSCPLKLFEYAGLRKPIVSTSTREVERIGRGWIAFADQVNEFADAIEHFLCDSVAVFEAVETGRALVEQGYNWPTLARRFVESLSCESATVATFSEPFPELENFLPLDNIISDKDQLGLAPSRGLASE